MRKLFFVVTVIALSILVSVPALASSFAADGSYLIGNVHESDNEVEQAGFLVNAEAELFPDILVEGRFLNMSGENDDNLSTTQNLMSGGAKYRVVNENGLEVTVGGGYTSYKVVMDEEHEGTGIYGKVGLTFAFNPQLVLVGDVSYAPRFGDDDNEGTLVSGRASVSYGISSDLGVQGTVLYNSWGIDDANDVTTTLYGGGIVLRF